jgi:hypothetical protein
MKKTLVYLVLFSLLVQIGCSSITQIPYPVDESKSDNEIRSLNYFGEKLSSTITLTNSIEVKAYWLKMKDDKIYFLTEGLDDTTSVAIDKIKSVRFYDFYGGCMKGGGLSLGLIMLEGIILWGFSSNDTGHPGAGIAILIIGPATILLSTLIGISFMGDREFNFVQSSQ